MADESFQQFLKMIEPFTGPLDLSEEGRRRMMEELGAQSRETQMAQPPKYASDHPAADEAYEVFSRLEVYSDDDYVNLARRDRYVWDVCWFDTQVMTNGIDGYLGNMGDQAVATLEAFDAIGAARAHSLLKRACEFFPEGRPSSRSEERWEQLKTIRGVERNLDDMIDGGYELDLFQLLMNYWRTADPKEK